MLTLHRVWRAVCLFNFLMSVGAKAALVETNLNSTDSLGIIDNDHQDVETCPLMMLIPFTDGRRIKFAFSIPEDVDSAMFTRETTAESAYGLLAAGLLAAQHFNDRDPSVVLDLKERIGDCKLQLSLPAQVVNTNRNPDEAARQIIDERPEDRPCVVVGPQDIHVSELFGTITKMMNVPMISYGNMPDHHGRPGAFPNVLRTAPLLTTQAGAFLSYISTRYNRKYLYVLEDGGVDSRYLAEAFLEPLEEETVKRVKVEIEGRVPDPEEVRAALTTIRESGIRTILTLLIRDTFLDDIATIADDLGMLTDEYWWIFSVEGVSSQRISDWIISSKNKPALYKLLNGAGVFQLLDGFQWRGKNDPFLNSWQSLDGSFIDLVNQHLPSDPNIEESGFPFQASLGYFQSKLPPQGASYVYDAVMVGGLALCNAEAEEELEVDEGAKDYNSTATDAQNRQLQPPKGLPPPPPPIPPVAAAIAAEIEGASGHLSFDKRSQTRDSEGLRFGVYNLLPRVAIEDPSSVYFEPNLSDFMVKNTWEQIQPYVFFSGEITPPIYDIYIENNNYLSNPVRVVCLCLMSLAMFMSVLGLAFVCVLKKDVVVKASQPEFLYLLCLGAFLLSSAIFPMSFDESYGWSESQLDKGCMAVPWLIFSGYLVIYLALFTKLWRLQKVMSFRRQKVTVFHVMGPFAVFSLSCLAVLIAFTVTSPWQWERTFVTDFPPETLGKCESDHAPLYMGVLAGLCLLATLLAAWMCSKVKDIQGEFSDSQAVFYILFTHFQSIVVGLPVIIILVDQSPTVFYLGTSLLLSTVSSSSVGFVLIPKAMDYYRRKFQPTEQSGRGSVRISGLSPHTNTTNTAMDASTKRSQDVTANFSAADHSTMTTSQTTQAAEPSSGSNNDGI